MEQNVIRESKCKDKLSSLSFHPHTYYIPIQDSESLNSSLKALQLVSKVPFDVVITNPNKVFTCDLSESSIQYLTLDNITYEYKYHHKGKIDLSTKSLTKQFSILYKHISPNKFKIKVNTSTIKKGKYEQEYAIVLKEKNEIIHTFDTFTIILIVKE